MFTSSNNPDQAISLYVTPLRNDLVNGRFKKPITIVSHWAVCIRGICYELRGGDKANGEQEDFLYKSIAVQEWIARRGFEGQPEHLGYMSRAYTNVTIDTIAQQVWTKTLNKKYSFDDNNCQAFVRLLIELIGDEKTKKNLPHCLDKAARYTSMARHATILGVGGGMALMAVGMVTAGVDMGATAAAGFGMAGMTVASSTSALLTVRSNKLKHIKKSQKEIKKELAKTHNIELE